MKDDTLSDFSRRISMQKADIALLHETKPAAAAEERLRPAWIFKLISLSRSDYHWYFILVKIETTLFEKRSSVVLSVGFGWFS